MKFLSWRWLPLLLCLFVGGVFYRLRPQSHSAPVKLLIVLPASSWTASAVNSGNKWLNRGVSLQASRPATYQIGVQGGDQVTFSPDGKWIIGSIGNSIERPLLWRWNSRTGALLSLQGTPLATTNYRGGFFLDSSNFVTVTTHNVLRVSQRGIVIQAYLGHGSTRGLVTWSSVPGEKEVAIVMLPPHALYNSIEDKQAPSIWRMNLKTGKNKHWFNLPTPYCRVSKMQWRAESGCILRVDSRILIVDYQGRVKWQEKFPINTKMDWGILDFYLSRDSKKLWILDQTQGLLILDTLTRKKTHFATASDFTSIHLTPKEDFVLLSNPQGRLAIYSLKTHHLVRQVVFPFSTTDLAFSPDGKQLAVGGVAVLSFDV